MSDDPQVPNAGAVIGAGVAALIEARPNAAEHLGPGGRYGNIVEGWRGQFELERRYLVRHIQASRISCEGDELSELTRSEYETERAVQKTSAIGEITLTRTVVHAAAAAVAEANTIDAETATDGDTVDTLLRALGDTINAHTASAFSAATGRGAHNAVFVGAVLPDLASTPTMFQMVEYAIDLRDYCNNHFTGASENHGGLHKDLDTFNEIDVPDPTFSFGGGYFASQDAASRASLLRAANAIKVGLGAHVALVARAGTIRAGDKFAVQADNAAVPPVDGSEYAVLSDSPINVGIQSVTAPVEATTAGPLGNLPAWVSGTGPTLVVSPLQPLFDASATLPLSVSAIAAAGGSLGQDDPSLRRSATAYVTGRHGPTTGAVVAGALRSLGVSRAVVRDNMTTATSYAYIVDESWAQSDAWLDQAEQIIRDDWLGFGCRLGRGVVQNQLVRVQLVVVLRDSTHLSQTAALTAVIQPAVEAHFDERPDYYVWRAVAIKNMVSRIDRRILRCSTATVLDSDDVVLSEPSLPTGGDTIKHFWLPDNAVTIEYSA